MLDTTAKRIALGLSIGLCLMVAWNEGWLSDVVPSPVPTADMVVVIEESGDRTAEQAVVLFGATAQSLRAAKQWRLLDKDELPAALKPIVAKIEAKPPYILFFAGESVVGGPIPFPATEAEFAAVVAKHGGK